MRGAFAGFGLSLGRSHFFQFFLHHFADGVLDLFVTDVQFVAECSVDCHSPTPPVNNETYPFLTAEAKHELNAGDRFELCPSAHD